ncbi:MAG: hypothetical protein QNK37_26965 [Acidobacteriota bacterium]|nr:hypothetical protein [Acidobacteriota bacterium]
MPVQAGKTTTQRVVLDRIALLVKDLQILAQVLELLLDRCQRPARKSLFFGTVIDTRVLFQGRGQEVVEKMVAGGNLARLNHR